MKYLSFLQTTLSAILFSVFSYNTAYANNGLKMQLITNKVVDNAQGQINYIPVRTATAGTIIQYKVTYTNTLAKDINDLTITLPIPTSMTFTGEAHPISAQASTDGKNYADIPLMRLVDAKVIKIPFTEYRYLQWNIKILPAKKSADVSFNTIVK
ncbi:hypothetical protein FHS24_000068 [Psychrobacter luti]|uniref:DUF11 domain-containing protein n=1 Tax=Psychrobacter luti TaxID=198481 RepID=A0A839T7W8_9GAMM|nr:hypothetical protein [Psychrobacter luti]MBB3105577.1 hypothetical protein [Psychrobacter luti]